MTLRKGAELFRNRKSRIVIVSVLALFCINAIMPFSAAQTIPNTWSVEVVATAGSIQITATVGHRIVVAFGGFSTTTGATPFVSDSNLNSFTGRVFKEQDGVFAQYSAIFDAVVQTGKGGPDVVTFTFVGSSTTSMFGVIYDMDSQYGNPTSFGSGGGNSGNPSVSSFNVASQSALIGSASCYSSTEYRIGPDSPFSTIFARRNFPASRLDPVGFSFVSGGFTGTGFTATMHEEDHAGGGSCSDGWAETYVIYPENPIIVTATATTITSSTTTLVSTATTITSSTTTVTSTTVVTATVTTTTESGEE